MRRVVVRDDVLAEVVERVALGVDLQVRLDLGPDIRRRLSVFRAACRVVA